jgi:Amidase
VARPSEAEAQLSFLGLSDLLANVLDETLEALPPPQRRALAAALLLDDPVGAVPEDRAIALAVLGVLQMLAEEHPVVVAVDDVQWLDRPTSAVLTYALRRLRDVSVALLVTARRAEPPRRLPIVEWGSDSAQVSHLDLEPLSAGAVHRLLVKRLGVALSRPVLIRLHDVTGGNPFYARELSRSLEPARYEPGAAWAIPPSLQELAAGGSAVGLGSDSGGSLRVPAHYCGVATLKPTSGRVPNTGVFEHMGGLSDTRTQIGPLSRFVGDLAPTLSILAGPDNRDSGVVPMPLGDSGAASLSGLRVAFYTEDEETPTTAETATAVREAANALRDAGANVGERCPANVGRDALEITRRY